MAWLKSHHHPYADEEEVFHGAGHFFFQPYTPFEHFVTWATEGPQGPVTLQFGGTVQADGQAAPRAWTRVLEFLRASLCTPAGARHAT